MSVDLVGTYMDTFDLKTLADTQRSVGTIVQPDGAPLDVSSLGVIPRWKHALTLGWQQGAWGASVTQNYYHGYRDANDLNGDKHLVPGQALYDAQATYSGIRNLKLTLGARNILDKAPPLFIGNGSSFQFGYDPTMYDARGRFIYVTAGYKFK
jgi:iron complex outermembrane recepter protein